MACSLYNQYYTRKSVLNMLPVRILMGARSKKRFVGAYLDRDDFNALHQVARRLHTSYSEVIRAAVRRYLADVERELGDAEVLQSGSREVLSGRLVREIAFRERVDELCDRLRGEVRVDEFRSLNAAYSNLRRSRALVHVDEELKTKLRFIERRLRELRGLRDRFKEEVKVMRRNLALPPAKGGLED